MRRLSRQGTRRQPATRGETLDECIGGTITGGPVRPIDLMEVLSRVVSGGGAVSGAAQVMASNAGASNGRNNGVALSDGSRICFSALEDTGDQFRMLVTA